MPDSLISEIKLLARHAFVYGGGIVFGQILSLLLLPFYTHFLTTTDYGIKELVGLTINVSGILIATALSFSFFRFYFEYETEEDKKEVFSTCFLGVTVIWLVTAPVFFFLSTNLSEHILGTRELAHYFQIAFGELILVTLNGLGFNYFRAKRQSVKTVVLSIIYMLITIGLSVYFVAIAKLGVLGILIANFLSSTAMFFIVVYLIIPEVGLKFSFRKCREMAKFGIPLIPSQLGSFAVNLSDRYFLKAFLSVADAGVYSVGYRFGTVTNNFIAMPFNQIWYPRRLEVFKQEESEVVFGKIFTYFLLLMIFAGLFISILTREALMVLTPEAYWGAYKIVPIIVLSITIFSLHNHFNMGIIIHKKTIYYAYIDTCNGILILLLNYFLIRKYGMYGAATATLIAHSFRSCLVFFCSRRHHKIYFEFLRVSKLLIAAFGIYFCSLYLRLESVWVSFLAKFFLVSLYPLLLLLIGFFRQEELEKIKRCCQRFLKRLTV